MMDIHRRLPVVATALTLLLTAGGAAAQAGGDSLPPESQGYMLIGGVSLDMDGLNTSLGARGFGELEGEMLSIGGGGHVLFGRWILGAEGFGLLPREAENAAGSWRARVSGGGGVVNAGYAVVRTERTSIYPMLGLGGGALTLELNEIGTPTFDDVLDDPRRGSTLNRVLMIVQPAVGIDHFIPAGEVDGMLAGAVVGVRVGYTFSPFTSDWYLDTARLAGSPDQGMEGAFIRVVIGGGSRRATADR
jgi:hypothetical protein